MPEYTAALVDAIARAICDSDPEGGYIGWWDDFVDDPASDPDIFESYRKQARAALAAMTSQTPQDATYGTHTTQPTSTDHQTLTGAQNGAQGRDRWADGYAAAKRYYGDTAPLALDKIRERTQQYRNRWEGRTIAPGLIDYLDDLQAILDTAQEPR